MQMDSYLVAQVIDSIGLSHGQQSKLVDVTKTVNRFSTLLDNAIGQP
jgi:hypothetical protein